MATTKNLTIAVGIKGATKLKTQLKTIKNGFKHIEKSIFSLKSAATGLFVGIGFYKIAEAMSDASQKAAEEQKQILMLQTVMKSMHRNVKGFTDSMIKLADAQELATGYGNEQIMSAEHMLATFSTISNKAMPEVLKTTEDLARGWGIDLTQAARIMGVASMGLTGQLTRYGITLSEQAKKTKDFKLILQDIQEQVKGSAEAYRYSFEGIKTTFYSVLDDGKKIFGRLENAVLGPFFEGATQMINEFNEKFSSVGNNTKTINKIQNVILGAVKNIIHAFAFLYNSIVDVAQGIKALKFASQEFFYAEDRMLGIFSSMYKKRAAMFKKGMDDAADAFMRLKNSKIDTSQIDKFYDEYVKKVKEANIKITAEHKKMQTIIPRLHLPESIPIPTATTASKNTEIKSEEHLQKALFRIRKKVESEERASREKKLQATKQVEDAILQIESSPFAYFKEKLQEQVAQFKKAGVSQILLEEYKTAKLKEYLNQIHNSTNKTTSMIQQMWIEASRNMADAFGRFFVDAVSGKLKNLGDYIVSFLNTVRNAMAQVLGAKVGGMVMGQLGSLFGSTISSGLGSMSSSPVLSLGAVMASANGNILKGGFQAFASGGIVTKPTLGLVGEGRYNEAVVPLPDGRSIPVKGGAPNVEINVINKGQPVDATKGQVRFDGKKWVVDVVLNAIQTEPNFRNAIRSV